MTIPEREILARDLCAAIGLDPDEPISCVNESGRHIEPRWMRQDRPMIADHLLSLGWCRRDAVLREAADVADKYADRPLGGDEQDTREAFDRGFTYTCGGSDTASAIHDAILSLTPQARKEGE